jgi:hypothetical protein
MSSARRARRPRASERRRRIAQEGPAFTAVPELEQLYDLHELFGKLPALVEEVEKSLAQCRRFLDGDQDGFIGPSDDSDAEERPTVQGRNRRGAA